MRDFFREKIDKQEGDLKKLEQFNANVADWYGVCPKCKIELRGTLEQVKAHHCDK